MTRLPFAAAALWLAAPAAFAQTVTFDAKVEDVQGTQNQFFADCTDTQLTSSLFNLNTFVGQQVRITGQWNGSTANPSVVVTAIQGVPEVFEIAGGAKIGETSALGFTAQPGAAVIGFLSLAPSFAPFGSTDVIFLDASQVVLSRTGTIGGTGVLELPFAIPNSPVLVGVELYGQGAVVAGGFVNLTNPDCKTIDN
jgi:hypothetical protein